MPIKTKVDPTRGLYQEAGSIDTDNACLTVDVGDTKDNQLAGEIKRALVLKTSDMPAVGEVSGSLLSLKGRSEGIHFHIGGNQYLSSNSWFNKDVGAFGSWIYETDSSAFRYGFRSSVGILEIDYAAHGTAGSVVDFGTGFSITGSNGAIAVGKKADQGVSATFDITGSNPVALAVTGSADIGGGATDAYIIFPRHTNTTRDALTAKAGMVIYNTQTNKLNFYNGSAWRAVDDSAV
tara:strand:- start:119 stop:826 length:708 start_codon:yes stop_codon:yes gene_type:complete